jgi:class 3 adenylate cyclase
LASGEEIVISAAALGALGDSSVSVSEPRTVELKGIQEPVEVRAVDWR